MTNQNGANSRKLSVITVVKMVMSKKNALKLSATLHIGKLEELQEETTEHQLKKMMLQKVQHQGMLYMALA